MHAHIFGEPSESSGTGQHRPISRSVSIRIDVSEELPIGHVLTVSLGRPGQGIAPLQRVKTALPSLLVHSVQNAASQRLAGEFTREGVLPPNDRQRKEQQGRSPYHGVERWGSPVEVLWHHHFDGLVSFLSLASMRTRSSFSRANFRARSKARRARSS